jgi:hypothetical protein
MGFRAIDHNLNPGKLYNLFKAILDCDPLFMLLALTGMTACAIRPSFWLRWGLVNFLPGLAAWPQTAVLSMSSPTSTYLWSITPSWVLVFLIAKIKMVIPISYRVLWIYGDNEYKVYIEERWWVVWWWLDRGIVTCFGVRPYFQMSLAIGIALFTLFK